MRRTVAALVGVVLAVVVQLVGIATPARAATGCDDIGTRVPVLLVHGWNGNPDTWTTRLSGGVSMRDVLNKVPGVVVSCIFDYSAHNKEWVTHPSIGPALAKRIDYLSQLSFRNSGKGKVIVVAHSMGGLATRYALNQTVSGRKVADETGLVVTLGTPNLGAGLDSIGSEITRYVCGMKVRMPGCDKSGGLIGLARYSRELEALPPIPPQVPVRAIGTRIKLVVQVLSKTVQLDADADPIVATDSATSNSTPEGRNDGGGKFLFKCTLYRYESPRASFRGGECWHADMQKASYIQISVVNGIKEALRSSRFNPGENVFFGALYLPLPKSLSVSPVQGDSSLTIHDPKGCGVDEFCPTLRIMGPNPYWHDAFQKRELPDLMGCMDATGGSHTQKRIVQSKLVLVSGRSAVYIRATLCDSGARNQEEVEIWSFTGPSLEVMSTDAPGGPPSLASLLGQAQWVD